MPPHLRISESKFGLGSYSVCKQARGKTYSRGYRSRSEGACMKNSLKQCIHKILAYIRVYVKYTEHIGPDLLFPAGPDLLFMAGPDPLLPARPDFLFILVRG